MAIAQQAATGLSLREQVAAEVRAWRARLKITQKEMGAVLGLSQASVSARMNAVSPFTLDELEVLSRRFGCSPADLLGSGPREIRRGQPMISPDVIADSTWRLRLVPALRTA